MRLAVLGAFLAVSAAADSAATDDGRLTVRAQGLTMALTARTPDQLAAFYAARGFPPDAVERIGGTCFITVSMRNDSGKVLWLEPGEWRLVDPQGRAARRIPRSEWDRLWDEIRSPAAHRATFGWTLLPENRNLQPGEAIGGNITLVPATGELALTARFVVGQDRRGGVLSVQVPQLRCAVKTEGAS